MDLALPLLEGLLAQPVRLPPGLVMVLGLLPSFLVSFIAEQIRRSYGD